MSARLIRKIGDVQDGVQDSMRAETDRDSFYARGLSTEGWNGGYQQALRDVMAHLQGFSNTGTRYQHLWDRPTIRKPRRKKCT